MRSLIALACLILLAGLTACSSGPKVVEFKPSPGEKHFKSLRQLTFDGTNAEAYFSPDGKKLIFQGHTRDQGCDQIYTMNLDGSDKRLVSRHGGRNTCGYYINDKRVLFSSTFEAGRECPKESDHSKGYRWDIFKSYDIYTAAPDGTDVKPLTRSPGYDAESTVCGGKIVFTSARRSGSLDIFKMNLDGTGVEKLTFETGYNGGPFFSPDCTKIVYRAFHPVGKKNVRAFKKAVRKGFVPPSPLELWVMDADGSHKRQLTNYNAASFAPSFAADNEHVIFSSNRPLAAESGASAQPGRIFHLWMISSGEHAGAPEEITAGGSFNGFPMFSPDGKYLVFASNRNSSNPHELQIFLAEWQP